MTTTTTAALLTEARALIAVAPWTRGAEVARTARTLLPQLADALVAMHAKVRERAIDNNGPHDSCRGCHLCRLCAATWREGEPETAHAPDCPARPMEPGT